MNINIERIGLLYSDIEEYNLLDNPMKKSDPRTAKYPFEKQAELDALPPDVLIKRVEEAIRSHLDPDAYEQMRAIQEMELNEIQTRFGAVQFSG